MKRRMLMMSLLAAGCHGLSAQNLVDLLSPGTSQLTNSLRQIVLLQVLINGTETGYAISESGLTAISKITGEEWAAHSDHVSGLPRVNPTIAAMAEVGQILTMERVI